MSNVHDEVYRPGQLQDFVAQFVREADIQWFLLGGPADGDEAQTMNQLFPDVQIIGFEPNPVMYQIQIDREFPGLLLPIALWSENCRLQFSIPNRGEKDFRQSNRCGSLIKQYGSQSTIEVEACSLDHLSGIHGPFHNAILWIDIEEAEVSCLHGASKLLSHRHITLINAEVFSHQEKEIRELLSSYSLDEVHRWNKHVESSRRWCDTIYKLRDTR